MCWSALLGQGLLYLSCILSLHVCYSRSFITAPYQFFIVLNIFVQYWFVEEHRLTKTRVGRNVDVHLAVLIRAGIFRAVISYTAVFAKNKLCDFFPQFIVFHSEISER